MGSAIGGYNPKLRHVPYFVPGLTGTPIIEYDFTTIDEEFFFENICDFSLYANSYRDV